MEGYGQGYTGNGKGKTTAALGLSLRAAAAGKQVFIGQFVKGMHYSELDIIGSISGISLKQFGRGCFIKNEPSAEDIVAARAGLAEIGEILKAGQYGVVVLDEANIALHYGLFTFVELWALVEGRAPGVEVVITGRYAPDELLAKADLVTEMREIKHYYRQGVEARLGIEK